MRELAVSRRFFKSYLTKGLPERPNGTEDTNPIYTRDRTAAKRARGRLGGCSWPATICVLLSSIIALLSLPIWFYPRRRCNQVFIRFIEALDVEPIAVHELSSTHRLQSRESVRDSAVLRNDDIPRDRRWSADETGMLKKRAE